MRIFCLGGYNEVGKNMTALEVKGEVIIFDMGLYMPKIVSYEEELEHFGEREMIAAGAIPDDGILEKLKDNVVGVFLSHAHLDHVGAVPYLVGKYKNASVYGTPYTLEILRRIIKDKGFKVRNKLVNLNAGKKVQLSKNIEVEFINVTHSTLQCVIIVVHTPEGDVMYANDFKLDNHPTLGKKPDYKRLRGLKGVKCLISNGLYSNNNMKTPSERVAREMLRDVLELDSRGKAIIVTSFASHIHRLKSIYDFGGKLNRKIVFLGRSLYKYVDSAIKLKLVRFPGVEIIGFSSKIKRKLKMIQKGRRDKFLIVCTGNQAEPGAVLSRMATGLFKFKAGDHVIFSSKTIPVDPNIANRAKLENKLKGKKVRIFKDVHVSGHASKEDLRDFIEMVRPKHIIPVHAAHDKLKGLVDLAVSMGYKKGKNVHLVNDRKILKF